MFLDVHDVTPSLMKGKVLHLMGLHFFMKKVCSKLVPLFVSACPDENKSIWDLKIRWILLFYA